MSFLLCLQFLMSRNYPKDTLMFSARDTQRSSVVVVGRVEENFLRVKMPSCRHKCKMGNRKKPKTKTCSNIQKFWFGVPICRQLQRRVLLDFYEEVCNCTIIFSKRVFQASGHGRGTLSTSNDQLSQLCMHFLTNEGICSANDMKQNKTGNRVFIR